MDYVIVFITCANTEEGELISRKLVEEKLVACVNTLAQVHSRYWWQGKIETAGETLLIAKTTAHLLDLIIERVKALHSYAVPEIIALPIAGGSADYLKWIGESIN